MPLVKKLKYKDASGRESLMDIGVDAKNVENVTFKQAETRANIKSGDKFPNILGMLMKWYADLKNVAWTGRYSDLADKPIIGTSGSKAVANNCTTTEEGSVLDARQGKVLMDKTNQINSDLKTFEQAFQDGCNVIVEAVTAKGQTPQTNSPEDIASAISKIITTKTISVSAKAHSTGGLTYIYVQLKCNGQTKQVSGNHKENAGTFVSIGNVTF